MRPDIRQFYDSIKIHSVPVIPPADTPLPESYYKTYHKRYPRLPRLELPETDTSGEFEELLARRHSTRNFTGEPLTLAELAAVLHSCRILSVRDTFERRTYPSGGARFPIEIYAVVFRADGFAPGCYHYDIEQSAIELLWEVELDARSQEFTSPYIEDAAAQLFLTTVISRTEVKYGSRAYPLSLLEAGHMMQNLSLAAERAGLGYCPIAGFVDDSVSEALDLTAEELPIYSMSLGKR